MFIFIGFGYWIESIAIAREAHKLNLITQFGAKPIESINCRSFISFLFCIENDFQLQNPIAPILY